MQTPETLSKSNQINRPPLVLIGASVREAAQSARRGGYRVIGIDLFGDTDTRELCDEFYLLSPGIQQMTRPELDGRVLAAIQGLPILPVGGLRCWPADLPSDGLFGSDPTENGVSENGVLGDHSSGQRAYRPPGCFRDFGELRDFAGDPAIGFPETIDAITPPGRGKWLRKRTDSCGGLGITWAAKRDSSSLFYQRPTGDKNQAADQNHLGDQGSETRLQRWVRGRPFGATLIHDGDQATLVGVCRSVVTRIGTFPFAYGGSIGPVALPPSVSDGITRFADRVAETRRLKGLFNIDFILDGDNRAWILEVNPRWSASMELLEGQLRESDPTFSLIAMDLRSRERRLRSVERLSLRCQPRSNYQPRSIYFKRIHFASRSQVFRRQRWTAALRLGSSLHDIPVDGQRIGMGEPICTEIERLDWNM
ncbi:MAG: ATP-grasp domain-containing protein [Planctomycetota bacterium]|nr:ATP-grasp domain-containing protein [Planctomycetota bacterium]